MTPARLQAVLLAVLLAVHVIGSRSAASGPSVPSIQGLELAAAARTDGRYAVWVFFKDKGTAGESERTEQLEATRAKLSPRALVRRGKVRAVGPLVDFSDLDVCPAYVRKLARVGARIRTESRWLNAASVSATPAQIGVIATWPFVKAIEPVCRFKRRRPTPSQRVWPKPAKPATKHRLDYGESYFQAAQIHVPELHDAGYSGQGLRICVLDAGFDQLGHEAFSEIRIVGAWDFLENDEDVAGDSHGTRVLSVLAAYKEGSLVGPAFGAEFLLGRTEDTRNDTPGHQSDTPIEEDYWIAGIEWAEQMGADIVSSSLGYALWDDGTGYTWDDLDGDTARTTLAADIAASKGVVVVVAAGNEGNTDWQRITTPADGDSVIAVGAVERSNRRAAFCSTGPTADGRVKPDVMALGDQVCGVDTQTQDGFTYYSGTSFACPLVAGGCALLLGVHPDWGPYEVLEALRSSAEDLGSAGPDTLYGWGLANVLAASGLVSPPVIAEIADGRIAVGGTYTLTASATGTAPITWLLLQGPDGMTVGETSGVVSWTPAFDQTGLHRLSLAAENEAGADTLSWDVLVYAPVAAKVFGAPYPNPSLSGTISFPFQLPSSTEVRVRVYTLAGELVWEEAGRFDSGPDALTWDCCNTHSRKAGGGIYLYRMVSGSDEKTGKIAVIR